MSDERSPAGEASTDEAFYSALLEDDAEELYDNAPCAYISALPDGTIAKVNRTFLRWTGYSRADLVGKRRLQDLLAPGDRIFYETHVAPLLRMSGEVREIAVEIIGNSGGRLPVFLNSVLKKALDGSPTMIRAAMFDATERRAYETELLAARRRAEESEARATALARTLQASFLPPTTLSVPGLDIGGAYRPAGDGSEVGGDFYDVFETGRGAWAIVLGDVCGKGATAAVLTALAKFTARAEAVRTSSPSGVLRGLHAAFVRYRPDEFCTAVCLLLTLDDRGGVHITVSSGGHHLPIRVDAQGRFSTIGEPGTILGMIDRPELTDVSVDLHPGDLVVLYTDGVTEARRDGDLYEEERLHAAIASRAHADAQGIADHIVADALTFQHGAARDDIAVVVLAVPQS